MASWSIAGSLTPEPADRRDDLLAPPVSRALASSDGDQPVAVVEIDPGLADTAEFCAAYGSPMDASANCVVVAGKRAGEVRYAAVMVLASTRADVNGVVKRLLDVRKASFAPMGDAVSLTGMEYGGITPVGLPEDWPVYVDRAVADAPELVIGSGIRGSKLLVTGRFLSSLPTAQIIEDLAH
ncbi:YbaK/EbsC family protein [Luteipulveratus flavus]|uniref:YbaK/EbsC family protein n=1 Tax=Luteipulveratus flavus TaxID=3031728 RepID=A0ABT6C4Q8_9MICO|nr:YbaK/EbsC family protein [Luteipulveratus sp. YIM 133296]MDF8263924.1 YbaK/EbsC family protein [Luteipulveratus sp. YIM 133296]